MLQTKIHDYCFLLLSFAYELILIITQKFNLKFSWNVLIIISCSL